MGRWDEAITACDAAIAGDADWASGLARYALAVCNVRLGRFDALDELRTRVEAEMAASQLPRLEALGVLGVIKLFSDDLTGAAEDLAEVADRARAGERTRLLVAALAAHAEVSFRLGHWEDAIVASELGASLAQDTEQIVGLQQAHAAAAVVHARCGRFDLSQAHVDTLGTIESLLPWWGGSALVGTSRAVLAEARGDHDAMYQAMASLVDHPTNQPGERLGQWNWLVVGVDALIGVGRLEVARALLAGLAALVAQRNLLTPAVELARLRGRLAEAADDLAQAELQYRTGAEASGAMPYTAVECSSRTAACCDAWASGSDAVDQLQPRPRRAGCTWSSTRRESMRRRARRVWRSHPDAHRRTRQPHAGRAQCCPSRRSRSFQSRGRGPSLRQSQDGRVSPRQHLRQAAHHIAPSTRGRVPRNPGTRLGIVPRDTSAGFVHRLRRACPARSLHERRNDLNNEAELVLRGVASAVRHGTLTETQTNVLAAIGTPTSV